MKTYFEVAVRYDKPVDGKVQKVTEQYLIDAMSFTEAEAKATEKLAAYSVADFHVVAEKITNNTDVVTTSDEDADKFYKMKYSIISINEKTGKEKKTAEYVIIQASSVEDARKRYEKHVAGWIVDTVLESVGETKYLDYFPHE